MHLPVLLFTLDNPEWLIILAIVIVLFGGSRLGQIGGALGQSIREFKKATRDDPASGDAPATPGTPAPPAGSSVTTVRPVAAGVTPAHAAAPPSPATPAPGDYLPPAVGSQPATGHGDRHLSVVE